ncbi:MAG: outer membrane beta-barrel domain-containing protein [Oligoflexia bacterium]|nr:outer membrane beta-barrel domain-containing protein [Oligoflexia bacterium]MBF0364217.1 outer membrane beta-barrel domain-containing protein [Oligoflexia bacterium]
MCNSLAKIATIFLLVLVAIVSIAFLDAPKSVASEQSYYEFKWLDPDKAVYVLQNRKYRKKGHFHLNAGGGMSVADAYLTASNLQARAGFFFLEDIGAEAIYGRNFASENDNAASVKSAGAIPFYRKIESYMGGLLLWSPFYSKMNTFNKIMYYDILLGLGAATISEENNRNHLVDGHTLRPLTTESHTAIMWNVGSQFYLSEAFRVRLDLLGQHYKAQSALKASPTSSESWYSHYDLTLSLGYSL